MDVVEALEDALHIQRGLLLRTANYPVDIDYSRYEQTSVDRHQNDMLCIVNAMLSNDLEFASCRHIEEQNMDVKIYSLRDYGGYLDRDLSLRLRNNFTALYNSFNPTLVKCFCKHLESGYPEVVVGRFQDAIDQSPYEIIETLRLVSARRKIEGTCPVCKDQT